MTQVAVALANPQARQKEPFNPNEHLMQIKNKQGANDYLPVQWRLVWFRELCPQGTIETEVVTLDLDKETEEEVYVWNPERRRSEKILKVAKGYALFKATIKDGKGGIATGYKSEKAASFPDYIEKAETGSIGRALAALGYGTQFAPELDEQHRIVDAPVEQRQPSSQEQKQYQERRMVVEAVPNESQPNQPVSIAFRDVYLAGGKKGMWANSAEFYAAASVILDTPVSGENVRHLDAEQITTLTQAVENEPVKPAAHASGT